MSAGERTGGSIPTREVKCDILVVGGGPAACFAAIKARETGNDVVLASKSVAGAGGSATILNHGALSVLIPGSITTEQALRETVETNSYHGNQDLFKSTIEANWETMREWVKFGGRFLKVNGKYIISHRHDSSTTSTGQIPFIHGVGRQLMWTLRVQCEKIGVRIFDRVMVNDLLTAHEPGNRRVIGAVGFSIIPGDFYVFQSKATIIATGRWHIPDSQSHHTADVSGDGVAMAYRAGCELHDPGTFHAVLATIGAGVPHTNGFRLVTESKIYNDLGEDMFSKTRAAIKAGRPQNVSITAAYDAKEGRSFYLDYTNLSAEQISLMYRNEKSQIASWDAVGINVPGKIPLTLTLKGSLLGISVDGRCRATIEGLYAAGEAAEIAASGGACDGVPACAAQGYIAGIDASKYVEGISHTDPNPEQIEKLRTRLYSPFRLSKGIEPSILRKMFWQICMDYFLIMNEAGLKAAIQNIGMIQSEMLPKMYASDFHNLMVANEVLNISDTIVLIPEAVLMSQESDMLCYREDYPQRNTKSTKTLKVRLNDDGHHEIWKEDTRMPFVRPETVKPNEMW